jgi:hypothetical protein
VVKLELNWFVTLKHGSTVRNCWVDKKVEVGNLITLKNSEEPDQQWRVMWRSEQARDKAVLGQGWHVGGL